MIEKDIYKEIIYKLLEYYKYTLKKTEKLMIEAGGKDFQLFLEILVQNEPFKDNDLMLDIYYSGQGDSGEDCYLYDVTGVEEPDGIKHSLGRLDWWDVADITDYDWVNNEGGYGHIYIFPFQNKIEIDGMARIWTEEPAQQEIKNIYEPT